MKSLYITSVENFSGKTAACLALGKQLQADGYQVGYLKPLSLQPWRINDKTADEDAAFVQETLGLDDLPHELSPVVISKEFLKVYLQGKRENDLMAIVQSASTRASQGKDVLLLEGGGSLREGHAVQLPTPLVARTLSSHVLVMVKYRSDVRLLDDTLSAQSRLEDLMIGAIINRVPDDARDYVDQLAIPFLEKRGVPIFGRIPHVSTLAALTVRELVDHLDASVLTERAGLNGLVESLTVGAMTAEVALHRFREYPNKAVITGGDRTDIQLAALETSTTCLILTGNLHPSPMVIRQAEEFEVAVLLVPTNTMETIEAIDRVIGKSRLGLPAKLEKFEQLFAQHVDSDRLYRALSLKE
ncbi:MAG: phosphotransacetylase family protein [Anaerolineales bacterium]|nr:phosphotransacetylase family protein [Anaerolineales bacterium]